MKAGSNIIRKTWPKIRAVIIDGAKFYQVDARRKGTSGKREYFSTKKDAETRAGEIEAAFNNEGVAGLTISAELRVDALKADALLQPHKKDGKPSILDAVKHHIDFLIEARKKSASKTIDLLAAEWLDFKKTNKNKPLRAATLRGIKGHTNLLKKHFGNIRLMDFTEKHLQDYLNGLDVGQRRRQHITNLTGQFFNWCIKKKYTTTNPAAEIEITVPTTDVKILAPTQAEHHLSVAVEQYPGLTLYVAISLFAGLRPFECQLLKWEQIHMEEKEIVVLGSTSKIKETRAVPIEDCLHRWLSAHNGARTGYVTRQENFTNIIKQYRAACGYKIGEENQDREEWTTDLYRHSYGSYWLAKYKDRAHLAENMGNSIQVIKKHYKQVVATSAVAAYWGITPETADNVIDLAKAKA